MSEFTERQMKVVALINANRYRGHRGADIDPIKVYERPLVPDLFPEHYGFGEDDLDRVFNVGTLHIGKPEATLREIHELLRDTYRGSVGTEVTHLSSTEQKRWVQERFEGCRGRPGFDADKKRDILRWVTAARKLEDYLHRKYVGQKRFSLEGGENLIPLLDEIVQDAGGRGVREAVIGMAHRGRLNVLVNILGKHPGRCSESSKARSTPQSAPATSSTTSASHPRWRHRADRSISCSRSIPPISRSSIPWSKDRSAHARSAAETPPATRCCRS